MNSKSHYILGLILALGAMAFFTHEKMGHSPIADGLTKKMEAALNLTPQGLVSKTTEPADNEPSLDTNKDMAELEKISDELLAFQTQVGDDPEKMTTQELEQEVTLMEAYNKQLQIVLKQTESSL